MSEIYARTNKASRKCTYFRLLAQLKQNLILILTRIIKIFKSIICQKSTTGKLISDRIYHFEFMSFYKNELNWLVSNDRKVWQHYRLNIIRKTRVSIRLSDFSC